MTSGNVTFNLPKFHELVHKLLKIIPSFLPILRRLCILLHGSQRTELNQTLPIVLTNYRKIYDANGFLTP